MVIDLHFFLKYHETYGIQINHFHTRAKVSTKTKESGPVLIGCGAGFVHDRPDAGRTVAKHLVACGGGYLIYETLAERTLAMAQMANREGKPFGRVEEFLAHSMPVCLHKGVKIIGNFGGANPRRVAQAVMQLAKKLGLKKPRIGIVTGDNLLAKGAAPDWLRSRLPRNKDARSIISANAYIGAAGMARALRNGADIVVAGRVADPSLALAAVMHARQIAEDDWQQLAVGTLAGHLLECGAQVSGGYYCDPGVKDVPRLDDVGLPIAEVNTDTVTVIKPPGAGGMVSEGTVKEQLLYEVHNPRDYRTPDVTMDISNTHVARAGRNRISVVGVAGRKRPEKLRMQICMRDGWNGDAEISYYGQTAPLRAASACKVLRRRLRRHFSDIRHRLDIIGLGGISDAQAPLSAVNNGGGKENGRTYDLRVRLSAHHSDRTRLQRALWEVESLYTNGPAGGGGVTASISPRLTHHIGLVPRDAVRVRATIQ